ncbi:MAG: hypothetical protein J7642_21205 [Cyanobacteria bacterium SBC]|nr:hypothetical protein [Cyanobacteria bacterium SBC]
MLDFEIFDREIDKFCRSFNRTLDVDLKKIWLETLSANLKSDEEFLASTRRVWATTRRFPCPADFVSAAKEAIKEKAEAEWQALLGSSPVTPDLSPAGQFALRIIGGTYTIAQTDPRELWSLRREFVAAYGGYQPGAETVRDAHPKNWRDPKEMTEETRKLDEYRRTPEARRNAAHLAEMARQCAARQRRLGETSAKQSGVPDPTFDPNALPDEQIEAICRQAAHKYRDALQRPSTLTKVGAVGWKSTKETSHP